jgi:uncharacterized membrane protein
LAAAVVIGAGFAVRRPLARVPENTLKFFVGGMLCSFGMFWAGEGLGVDWPGGDVALPILLVVTFGLAGLMVRALRVERPVSS